MSEMTVFTSFSMRVSAPPGLVNISSTTETTSSPSWIMSSRISGAREGSASMNSVIALQSSLISSQMSVARSSMTPGMLPWRIWQTN